MSDDYDEIARTEMEAERDAVYGPRPTAADLDGIRQTEFVSSVLRPIPTDVHTP